MSQKNSKLEFVLRKLQSLSGFLPLCIFLLFHVVANATAIAGPVLWIYPYHGQYPRDHRFRSIDYFPAVIGPRLDGFIYRLYRT